jgi:hypothetical protein
MRQQWLFKPGHTAGICVSLVFMFLLTSMALRAQTPTNFSGKWEFDKTKSSPGIVDSNFDGIVTRHITQNPSIITYRDIYVRKGSNDWKTADEQFRLDGKEQVKKDGTTTSRKSAQWSQDKKILTLTYRETYVEEGVSKELLVADSYKLSDDGKTLTIETYSKNQVTGETKTQGVYHKK